MTRHKSSVLRKLLAKRTVAIPGAFNVASALLIESFGFEAVYVTGAGVSASALGLPDIGLASQTEMVEVARRIAQTLRVPVISDADTGYGEAINVYRTIREFEAAGVAGIHLEDQELPKRCGHLAGKSLVSKQAMVEKLKAAVAARQDPNFVIIARTDARSVTGLSDAIDRARAYKKAGADILFPEALESKEEFSRFAKAVGGLLLANMTEFGKTPYMTVRDFEKLGYRAVLFPMTLFRASMKAMDEALQELKKKGMQKGFLSRLQPREDLARLLGFCEYDRLGL